MEFNSGFKGLKEDRRALYFKHKSE